MELASKVVYIYFDYRIGSGTHDKKRVVGSISLCLLYSQRENDTLVYAAVESCVRFIVKINGRFLCMIDFNGSDALPIQKEHNGWTRCNSFPSPIFKGSFLFSSHLILV